jgi:hypothetical protein
MMAGTALLVLGLPLDKWRCSERRAIGRLPVGLLPHKVSPGSVPVVSRVTKIGLIPLLPDRGYNRMRCTTNRTFLVYDTAVEAQKRIYSTRLG